MGLHAGDAGHSHEVQGHDAPHPAPLAAPIPLAVKQFALSDYVLTPGSRFAEQQLRNLQYLTTGFNLTDLTCEYSSAANLTGTWAAPTCRKLDNNGYWGHYLGHYLSATAMLTNNTGSSEAREAGATVVATLATVQGAWTALGDPYMGYLFPYSILAWDSLLNNAQNCAPVCVPFYILHKMLQGLLDQYVLAGNAQALAVLLAVADWAVAAVTATLARGGQTLWQAVLDTEWGGMNDVLLKVGQVTGDDKYTQTSLLFNHWAWVNPFLAGSDGLSPNHANTHIPEIIGDQATYEYTGNTSKYTVTTNFFGFLNESHTYATGGSNDYEHWGAANQLGDAMNDQTEESCTQYNILKVARHFIQWNGRAGPQYADFYERALFNGLVGNQARTGQFSATTSTGFIYMLPLGGAGLRKPWGQSNENLPCCWGTLSETFSKLGDSVMFAAEDDSALLVNLFVSLSLTWRGRGGTVITQASSYPYVSQTTTTLTTSSVDGSTWTLAVRVPIWAVSANALTLNGAPLAGPFIPGSYFNVTRAWANGDVLTAWFPPSLSFEPLNDERQDVWGGVGAIMYGGILLAGVNSTSDALAINASLPLLGQLFPDPSAPAGALQFLAPTFGTGCDGAGNASLVNMTLIPLMDVTFEAYAVYMHTRDTGPRTIGYNGSSEVPLPSATAADFEVNGGATITANGPDTNIRSGDPGQVNVVFSTAAFLDPTHSLSGFNFTFRYVAGYGADGAPGGTTFRVLLYPGCDQDPAHLPVPLAVLYTSPVLSHFPFDACNTCYSPPMGIAGPLDVPVSAPGGVRVAFEFTNNNRNAQLDLPLGFSFTWN